MSKLDLEGLGLSAGLAARVLKPAFRLLITNPSDIERMHLADLNSIVRRPPLLTSPIIPFSLFFQPKSTTTSLIAVE